MPTVAARPSRAAVTPPPRHRAKVFWTGRSQAIRLPKEMRLSTREVVIRRQGKLLVVEPLEVERDPKGWPEAWWKLAGAAPDFDLGDRRTPLERGDIFKRRR